MEAMPPNDLQVRFSFYTNLDLEAIISQTTFFCKKILLRSFKIFLHVLSLGMLSIDFAKDNVD